MAHDNPKYPPGVQPYDSLNGARIGVIAGGILALIPGALIGPPIVWLVAGAFVGGLGGFVWQRRENRQRSDDNTRA